MTPSLRHYYSCQPAFFDFSANSDCVPSAHPKNPSPSVSNFNGSPLFLSGFFGGGKGDASWLRSEQNLDNFRKQGGLNEQNLGKQFETRATYETGKKTISKRARREGHCTSMCEKGWYLTARKGNNQNRHFFNWSRFSERARREGRERQGKEEREGNHQNTPVHFRQRIEPTHRKTIPKKNKQTKKKHTHTHIIINNHYIIPYNQKNSSPALPPLAPLSKGDTVSFLT